MKPAQHISQAIKYQKKVLFTGTASTTYYRGEGVCYDRNYGTAATAEGRRDKYVEPCDTSNNLRFAGVLDDTITLDTTGTAMVLINEPGSVCHVAAASDTTVDVTVLSCLCSTGSPGRWRADAGTCLGRGAALALQTTTTGITGESTDGTAVVSTATVTDTGLFTGAAAGDKVVIIASSTAAGATGATQAIYTIGSVTTANEAVLTASPGNGDICCYVMSPGRPTVLAYLYDGEETGLIEWKACLVSAAAQTMVGGVTHIFGGVTLAGDSTSVLADGTFPGQKKGYVLSGALTTSSFEVTVTSGIVMAGTALDTITFSAALDAAILEWWHSAWRATHVVVAVEA